MRELTLSSQETYAIGTNGVVPNRPQRSKYPNESPALRARSPSSAVTWILLPVLVASAGAQSVNMQYHRRLRCKADYQNK